MNPLIDIEIARKVKEETTIRKKKNILKNKTLRNSRSKYESKCEDLKKTFVTVSDSEKLIYDCTCALQKDILYQGRLYICLNGFYFHANVFRKDILMEVKWKDVLSLKRSKTAKLIPNAILIKTKINQIFFVSFGSRDKTFVLMHRLFMCAIKQTEMSKCEINHWVHFYYQDLSIADDSNNLKSHKLFRNKVRNQLKLLQQHISYDLVQEVNYCKEKHEDRGQSETNCSNLLNVPTSFEASNFDGETNDGSEVFGDDSKTTSNKSRSPSPFSRYKKRNGLFPLKKTRSRSFENLEDLNQEEVVESNASENDGEKKRRRSLQVPRKDAASEESEKDSDPISKFCGHSDLSIPVLDEILHLSAENVFRLCFSDSRLYREFVDRKKTSVCHWGGHKELPETVLENTYPVDVNTLFKKMFHKSHFWSKLLKLNNAKDVVLSPWTAETDGSGARVRNISYTLSLDIPCGPKHASTSEKQVLHADSTPGEIYLVDTECVNEGLPYGEDFYIVNRYCISKISEDSCRLRITSQIKYRRKVFGLVKSFIDRNATAGIMETFAIMGRLLKQEANQSDETPGDVVPVNIPSRKKISRKKVVENDFKIPARIAPENGSVSFPISATINRGSAIVSQFIDGVRKKHNERWILSITFAQAVQIVTALALALCLFNIFLYFKMNSLQNVTSQFEARIQKERVTHEFNALRSMASSMDAGGDIRRWKEAMSSLLVMMEDVVHSMSRLERIIATKQTED